jgi:hypothetical protein
MATKAVTKAKAVVKVKRDITKELKDAVKREAEGWVDFSTLAHEAYYSEEWRQKGYENPKDYVEKELDGRVSYEIFMHRVKMGEVIKKYGLRKDEIIGLGWSKFKDIATLALYDENMSVDTLKGIIEEAHHRTCREVQDFVRREKTKVEGGSVSKTAHLKFKLIDEQDNVVKEALAIACELAETDNLNVALVYMATEFITNHAPSDSDLALAIREKVKSMQKEEAPVKHKPHAHKKKLELE